MPIEEADEKMVAALEGFHCRACGSCEAKPLGLLGSRYYVRCRACGADDFASPPEEDSDEDLLGEEND